MTRSNADQRGRKNGARNGTDDVQHQRQHSQQQEACGRAGAAVLATPGTTKAEARLKRVSVVDTATTAAHVALRRPLGNGRGYINCTFTTWVDSLGEKGRKGKAQG